MHPATLLAAVGDYTGPIVQGNLQTCAGSFSGLAQVINGIIGLAIYIGILIAVLMIAYAGFLWVTNPVNPENRSAARNMLLNAAVGLVLTLAAWLIVNTVLIALGYSGGISTATSALFTGSGSSNNSGGCLTQTAQGQIQGGGIANSNVPTSGGTNEPLSTNGTGACDPSQVQQGAQAGNYTLSNQQANILACIANYESNCGAVNQNYNWGKGSSAYGAFQVTLEGNSNCYDNAACEQAVGASGPLNCKSGFSGGNPIPGSQTAATCEKAASNLSCSSAAAACVLKQQGFGAWTADSHSSNQAQCIQQG